MAQRQMEQFLGKFNERLWWMLTYRHAGGGVVGMFAGSRVGQLLGGGAWTFGMGILGVLLGIGLVWTVNGHMRAVRWAMLGWFYARQALGRRTIDPSLWAVAPADASAPSVELELDGQTFVSAGGTTP